MSEDLYDYGSFYFKIDENNISSLDNYFEIQTLESQQIYIDSVIKDDGVWKVDLPSSWGETAYFEYNGEGSLGITVPSLPKKNSDYTYGRMYYYGNIEPDFQIIFRIDSDDGYSHGIKLKYNDTKIVGIFKYKPRKLSSHINIYFEIQNNNGDFILSKLLFKNETNQAFDGFNNLLYGVKNYSREIAVWRPDSTAFRNDSLIYNFLEKIYIPGYPIYNNKYYKFAEDDSFLTNYQAKNLTYLYEDQPSNYKDNNIKTIVYYDFNDYKITHKNITKYNSNDSQIITGLYEYTAFIEGKGDLVSYQIINNMNFAEKFIYKSNSENNIILKNLIRSEYVIRSGDYFKKFTPNSTKPMIKSEIYGNVDVKKCGNGELIIKCFRSDDNLFIGYYPIIEGSYTIPNLDYNTKYDIILVDKSRRIEQKVSSYRTPTPYKSLNLSSIDYFNLRYDGSQNGGIEITYIISGDYDEVRLYKSNSILDINNLPIPISINYQYNVFLDRDYNLDETYKYIIAVQLGDKILYSSIKEITPTNN